MRIALLLSLGTLLSAGPLGAHPIHTTLTEVTVSRVARGYSVELRIRAFVDDFSAAVATSAGKTVPRDSSFAVPDAASYLLETVGLFEGRKRVALEWCGVRREREVVWLCLRSRSPVKGNALSMSQRMHMEMFKDQINLVRSNRDGRVRSLLFSPRDRAKPLG